ncbi:ABC transporter permease [Candidatus Fermentibacteria bacterium]|nr:ABC transporter permease [Candidatus Fermentibacteria bacterium]
MGSLSFHLAWRYIRRHPQRRTIAFTAVVSVAGVALGVAALLVVNGVLDGLGRFIAESVQTVDAPLAIVPVEGASFRMPDSLLAAVESLPGVATLSPYIEGEAVARLPARNIDSGCRVKGVFPEREFGSPGLPIEVVYGGLRLSTPDGVPGTVMGLYLAEQFAHPLGDTLLLFPPRSFFSSRGFAVGRVVLCGAVETGLPVNDRAMAWVPLEVAQAMFLPEGGFSGVSVRLDQSADPDGVAASISALLPDNAAVETWQERNPTLTASMELERLGSMAAILLVTLVATFNIAGTIARSVIERRRDISILKAMGAGRGLVVRLFLWEGVLVGAAGVAIGLALGLAGCWVIGATDLLQLPDVYSFHERIPVHLGAVDACLVCIAAFALSVLSGVFPAVKAAGFDPVRGLRG